LKISCRFIKKFAINVLPGKRDHAFSHPLTQRRRGLPLLPDPHRPDGPHGGGEVLHPRSRRGRQHGFWRWERHVDAHGDVIGGRKVEKGNRKNVVGRSSRPAVLV
jgi:hypothetical protein